MDFVKAGHELLSNRATRVELIDYIRESAGDEYDNVLSLWHLAKKTEKELKEVVKSIVKYYENEQD